jgi:hypothetical protein
MRSRRCRFVPQVDLLARRIVLDVGAAALATPLIAPDGSQGGSNGSGSVDPSATDVTASGSSSTDSSAVDSALDDLDGPDDSSDDSEFNPDSTGLLDDSEFTTAIPVSGVSAY